MITFLREVHLASNQLPNFPLAFCALPNLNLLDLSNNLITTIPPEISSLQALELNLNNNKVIAAELFNVRNGNFQIWGIHRDISRCPNLQILRLEDNCLTLETLPTSILR